MKTVLWSMLCLFLSGWGSMQSGISTGLERDGKELVRHQRGIESKDKRI